MGSDKAPGEGDKPKTTDKHQGIEFEDGSDDSDEDYKEVEVRTCPAVVDGRLSRDGMLVAVPGEVMT